MVRWESSMRGTLEDDSPLPQDGTRSTPPCQPECHDARQQQHSPENRRLRRSNICADNPDGRGHDKQRRQYGIAERLVRPLGVRMLLPKNEYARSAQSEECLL